MATYTIRSTSNDISRLVPTNLSRDEAARWARSQAKADLMSYGLAMGCDGRIEAEYTDEGENSAYVIIQNATHTTQGHQPQKTLGKVEIVAVD